MTAVLIVVIAIVAAILIYGFSIGNHISQAKLGRVPPSGLGGTHRLFASSVKQGAR